VMEEIIEERQKGKQDKVRRERRNKWGNIECKENKQKEQ
jgi:hypothetical protein